jgi:ribosomal protein S18 acetylase RimI-like enzyme
MSSWTSRPLLADDYEDVMRLFTVVFPVKYKNEFLDCWLQRIPELSLGAFLDGILSGFIVSCPKGDDGIRIEFLGVDPSTQKGGIGTGLLSTILDFCRETRTRVTLIPINEPRVIRWYKRHGFLDCGSPQISPYTGDLEQIMELSPSKGERCECA